MQNHYSIGSAGAADEGDPRARATVRLFAHGGLCGGDGVGVSRKQL